MATDWTTSKYAVASPQIAEVPLSASGPELAEALNVIFLALDGFGQVLLTQQGQIADLLERVGTLEGGI